MGNNKISSIVFLFFGFHLSAQDSTAVNKQNQLIDRFESITGKEGNVNDSIRVLREKLSVSASTIKQQNTTIDNLKAEISELEKYYLIGKYGQPGNYVPYGKQQFDDFQKSAFLKKYNASYPGIHVYFAFEETTIDLSLYDAMFAQLANELKSNPTKKVNVSGYSDSWGKSETNQIYAKDRAALIKEYLIKQYGIPANAIVVQHFGTGGPNRYKESEMDFLNRQVVIAVL